MTDRRLLLSLMSLPTTSSPSCMITARWLAALATMSRRAAPAPGRRPATFSLCRGRSRADRDRRRVQAAGVAVAQTGRDRAAFEPCQREDLLLLLAPGEVHDADRLVGGVGFDKDPAPPVKRGRGIAGR